MNPAVDVQKTCGRDGRAPRVSVIVPAYDQPGFLEATLRSVRAQTFAGFELIVVDDGSPTDLEPAFARAAEGDPRFRYLRQANAGGSAARNRGVREARGEWIAFLDHDDLWLPDKLEAQIDAIDRFTGPPPGLCYCQFEAFADAAGPAHRTSAPFPEDTGIGEGLDALLERTLIRTLSVVLVHRDAVPGGAPWFRPELAISSDVDLYYRIARHRAVVFVPQSLVLKRDHASNASADVDRLHAEAVRIVDDLERSLAVAGPIAATTRRLIRQRRLRHLLGGARAARRSGNRRAARALYRRAIASAPTTARAWIGLTASILGC